MSSREMERSLDRWVDVCKFGLNGILLATAVERACPRLGIYRKAKGL
jgi:hypothetical protein